MRDTECRTVTLSMTSVSKSIRLENSQFRGMMNINADQYVAGFSPRLHNFEAHCHLETHVNSHFISIRLPRQLADDVISQQTTYTYDNIMS